MNKKYWEELEEIFTKNKELSKDYSNLSRLIHLVNKSLELEEEHSKKADVINKELAQLNKD